VKLLKKLPATSYFGGIWLPHWNRQDLTAHPSWSWQICCASRERKWTFICKQHFFPFPVFYRPIFFAFCFHFLCVRSCLLAVSWPFCQPPVGDVALYLSLRELHHASNPSVHQDSFSLHTFCNACLGIVLVFRKHNNTTPLPRCDIRH